MIAEDGTPVRRIMVYGVTGSGKTTLARRLAERADLTCYAVDDLTWEADWVPVPVDEQRRRIAAICDRDDWVLDHAYGQWIDLPLARVQVIIGLDYPRWLSLARLIRRSVINIVARRPTCNGNVETWRKLIADDSILRWHFQSFANKRARIRSWAADPAGPRVISCRSPAQAERLLREL